MFMCYGAVRNWLLVRFGCPKSLGLSTTMTTKRGKYSTSYRSEEFFFLNTLVKTNFDPIYRNKVIRIFRGIDLVLVSTVLNWP